MSFGRYQASAYHSQTSRIITSRLRNSVNLAGQTITIIPFPSRESSILSQKRKNYKIIPQQKIKHMCKTMMMNFEGKTNEEQKIDRLKKYQRSHFLTVVSRLPKNKKSTV